MPETAQFLLMFEPYHDYSWLVPKVFATQDVTVSYAIQVTEFECEGPEYFSVFEIVNTDIIKRAEYKREFRGMPTVGYTEWEARSEW